MAYAESNPRKVVRCKMEALFSMCDFKFEFLSTKHETNSKFKFSNDQNDGNQNFQMGAGKLELIQVACFRRTLMFR